MIEPTAIARRMEPGIKCGAWDIETLPDSIILHRPAIVPLIVPLIVSLINSLVRPYGAAAPGAAFLLTLGACI